MKRYHCKEQLCQGHILSLCQRGSVTPCPPELTLCTVDTCSRFAPRSSPVVLSWWGLGVPVRSWRVAPQHPSSCHRSFGALVVPRKLKPCLCLPLGWLLPCPGSCRDQDEFVQVLGLTPGAVLSGTATSALPRLLWISDSSRGSCQAAATPGSVLWISEFGGWRRDRGMLVAFPAFFSGEKCMEKAGSGEIAAVCIT